MDNTSFAGFVKPVFLHSFIKFVLSILGREGEFCPDNITVLRVAFRFWLPRKT